MNWIKLDENKKIQIKKLNIEGKKFFPKEVSDNFKKYSSGKKLVVKRGKVYQLKKRP